MRTQALKRKNPSKPLWIGFEGLRREIEANSLQEEIEKLSNESIPAVDQGITERLKNELKELKEKLAAMPEESPEDLEKLEKAKRMEITGLEERLKKTQLGGSAWGTAMQVIEGELFIAVATAGDQGLHLLKGTGSAARSEIRKSVAEVSFYPMQGIFPLWLHTDQRVWAFAMLREVMPNLFTDSRTPSAFAGLLRNPANFFQEPTGIVRIYGKYPSETDMDLLSDLALKNPNAKFMIVIPDELNSREEELSRLLRSKITKLQRNSGNPAKGFNFIVTSNPHKVENFAGAQKHQLLVFGGPGFILFR